MTAFLPVLAALVFLPLAATPPNDGILFGESFALADRETYTGDLIAVDSRVSLAGGSTFEGNLILLGGSLESAGDVAGDIACVGAEVHIGPTSSVRGSIACFGAVPEVDDGARIAGSVNAVQGQWLSFGTAGTGPEERGSGRNGPGYAFTVVLFRIFLLSAAAILIVLFFPSPARRVAQTIIEKPAVSLLIGLLTVTTATALFLLLALTVCLSPVSLLGSAVVLVAVLLGWTALGWEIGRSLFRLMRVDAHPAVMAGAGTAILTLAASLAGYIPFAGLVLIGLGLSFGLGAVVLTRFGGPEYRILPDRGSPNPPSA